MGESIVFGGPDAYAGFLAHLHEDEVATVLSYAQVRRYAVGALVVRVGETERSVYIVTAGRFEVLVPSRTGAQRATVLQRGDMFGELAFFDGQPRSADVRAIEDSETLVMTPAGFERLRLTHPRLALSFVLDLGRILSVRFRDYSARFADLGNA